MDIFCFKTTRQINRKSLTAYKVKRIEEQLDRLFDIASCYCKLPILGCEEFVMKSNKENCQTRHIVCTCLPNKKVILILWLFFVFSV